MLVGAGSDSTADKRGHGSRVGVLVPSDREGCGRCVGDRDIANSRSRISRGDRARQHRRYGAAQGYQGEELGEVGCLMGIENPLGFAIKVLDRDVERGKCDRTA